MENKQKPFYFFKAIADSAFAVIIGSFVTLFLIFLTLASVFFSALYNQFCLFLLFGAVFFTCSYYRYMNRFLPYLKSLSYDGFLASRTQLVSWILWSFNFYFMGCWFILLLLGSMKGFGLTFPTPDKSPALIYTDNFTTKILGLVLWLVHIFLWLVFKTIANYWTNIVLFAHREFEKRRKNLEEVRTKAQQETLS
ncbi:hypothetical protein MHC_00600 [Mycoplasma haemocanis str. Illinois]|uniref:Uncharacterized protein n=1 Tax=Mycoplasma haemocanis (strain Illinois) TaxID=1111676 RepID=H6N5M6_MYCHN|nr:hypothetical protein [Mycoplasma haemocanis]AEW44986.1 hypothetical protein MHC_00600 [Mycoplasma haemocanis str. Illinois]